MGKGLKAMGDVVTKAATDLDFADQVERYRRELHLHCYRMLGSFTDAEDLVQETLLRAWRHRADLVAVNNVRAWLYKIATNGCLDLVRARKRRVSAWGSFRDVPWLEPYPDRMLDLAAPEGSEPSSKAVQRETIELTFLALIQILPPRQRAAVVLRDVLDWPVSEIGALLELSTPAVNSALQRGRATLRSHRPATDRDNWVSTEASDTELRVLSAYIAAYEAGEDGSTLALIADDIRVTMPPAPFLFEGREAIRGLSRRARDTGTWRLVATGANRQPAAACYLYDPDTGQFQAFKMDVLCVVDGMITEITAFGHSHFPAFGLPAVLA